MFSLLTGNLWTFEPLKDPKSRHHQVEAKAFAIQGLEAFHAIAGGHWEKGLQLITKAGLGVGLSTDTLWTSQCELLSFAKKSASEAGQLLECPGTGPEQGAVSCGAEHLCRGGMNICSCSSLVFTMVAEFCSFFQFISFVTLTHGVWQDDGIASRPQ